MAHINLLVFIAYPFLTCTVLAIRIAGSTGKAVGGAVILSSPVENFEIKALHNSKPAE